MAVAERSRRVEDLFGTPAQGNPVFPLGLRARGRDGPDVALRVDIGPLRPADLTGSRRREHEELEGELDHGRSTRRLHRADGRRHVAKGPGPHVLDQILLWPRTGPMRSHGLSALRSIATAHSITVLMRSRTRRAVRRADMPDGPQRLDHVGARHLGDRQLANAREREPRHARHPILAVLRIAPTGLHLGPDLLGGGGEGRRALETAPSRRAGSPPARASLRLAKASARASLSETSGKPPSPSSRRRPRMAIRWTQLRLPDGWTSRYKPWPSQYRPAAANEADLPWTQNNARLNIVLVMESSP